jgi:hypothetical protein
MRKIVLSLAFALALSAGLAPARAAGFPPGFPAADASRLLRAADQGLADLERLAADPKAGLDSKNPKIAPFRGSLTFLRSVMDELRGSLASGDAEFFGFLDQGSAALGELRVTWARTGVHNETIAGRIRVASASYRLLRSTCGREGLRQRQGGALSQAERRQLQRIQRSERRFAERLQLVRDRARREGDRITAEEMERFRLEAERIAWASADLETYLNTLIAASELRGEWSADAPYVRKTAPPEEVAAADEAVQDLYVDSDIGQVFAVNLGKVDGDGDGAASAPAPGAVQTFEASGEVVAAEAIAEPMTLTSIDEPVEAGEEMESEGEPVEGVEIGEAVEPAGEDAAEEVEEKAAGETPVQPAVEAAAKPETKQATKPKANTPETPARPSSPPPPVTPPNPPTIG